MTRATRKAEEAHFAQVFLNWLQKTSHPDAREILGITDRPDMAINTNGARVAVEFAQIPSSYIIEHFHKKMPAAVHAPDQVVGNLVIYPFEPHRWVHEVVKSKEPKADAYKLRANANEIWLVLHCHSVRGNWPMSRPSSVGSREMEAQLMRFGLKATGDKFQRIFFIYAEGTVVDLTADKIPSAISLRPGTGYPAVTAHGFSFGFHVPSPGLGIRKYDFDPISFNKVVIDPIDDWMANTHPEIDEPSFSSHATVSSELAEWKVFRDGNVIQSESRQVSEHAGKPLYMWFLLEWSVKKTSFEVQY